MAKKRKCPPAEPQAEQQEREEELEEDEEEDDAASSSSSEEEEEDDDDDDEGGAEDEDEDDESDESSKREALQKLLEPFNKDQLIGLIKESALNDPQIRARITRFADSDPAHRKIFVHGLPRDTTQSQILHVFQPFGEIEECKLITDKATGRAKGYAFVLFKNRASAKSALEDPQKQIGNRMVSCQLASLGPTGQGMAAPEVSARKIYVANVGPQLDADKLRAFFARFGEIEEGPLGFDSVTNRSRGFAIFVYKTAQGCKKALEEPRKTFDGCELYCKKFIENNANSNNAGRQGTGDDNYGAQGIMSSNLNLGSLMMAQNQGYGFAGNPVMGSVMNPSSFGAPGLSPNYGINPGLIAGYGSQGMLQGLGAYQGAQMMGQPSAGGAAAGTKGSQSGGGSAGKTFPSYSGH